LKIPPPVEETKPDDHSLSSPEKANPSTVPTLQIFGILPNDGSQDKKPKSGPQSNQDSSKKPNDTDKKKEKSFTSPINSFEDFFVRLFSGDGSIQGTNPFLIGNSRSSPEENQTEISLDVHYKLGMKPMTFVVPEDVSATTVHTDPEYKQYVLSIYGLGSIKIEIFDNATNKTAKISERLSLDMFMKPSFLPFDPLLYLNKKGNILKISTEMFDMISPTSFELGFKKPMDVPVDSSIKIFTKFSKIVNFVVVNNPPSKALSPEEEKLEKRLQFILDSSLALQKITGSESLAMFINRDQHFPTNKTFDIQASGSLGNGLIKTLGPSNTYYCLRETCKYYVSIYVDNISFVTFMPTIFANGSTLKFQQFMFLIEELEINEEISYVMQVPKSDDNWIFSLFPMEGGVKLYINPDIKPEKLEDYKYSIGSHRKEELIITGYEANKFDFSHEKYFVTYRSLDPSQTATFRFEARRFDSDQRNYIKEDVSESGVVAITETIQYYINFQNFEDSFLEVLQTGFRLDTYFGNNDIFIKECLQNELHCKITEDDMRNSFTDNYKDKYADRIFLFSHFDNPESNEITRTTHHTNFDRQRLNLNVNCLPFVDEFVQALFNTKRDDSKIKESVHNGFPFSKSCNFVIGINCRNSTNKYGAYYKLVAMGSRAHKSLYLKHSRTVKVSEKGHAYLKIQLKKSEITYQDELNLKAIAISGKMSIYASTKFEYPNKENNEAMIEINDESISDLHTILKELTIPLPGPPKIKDLSQLGDGKQQTRIYQLNQFGGIEESKDNALNPQYSLKDVRESSTSFRSDALHQLVFITIKADTYSIVDLYVDKSEKTNIINSIPEKLLPSKLISRSIGKMKTDSFVNDGKTVYFKNFYYRYHPWHKTGEDGKQWLDIKINSEVFGLKLCIQTGTENLNPSKPCEFHSDNQSISISDKDYDFVDGSNIVISVQKVVASNESFNKFPIEFSIFVNPGNENSSLELLTLNRVFGFSIEAFQTMTFALDLDTITDSFMILFESESVDIQNDINVVSGKEYSALETLDKFKFGLFITDIKVFKKKHCKSTDCKINMTVFTAGNEASKFSIVCSVDKKPLPLKEGDVISIPNNIDQYFVYETDNNEPVNFSVTSDQVSHVLYSKIINNLSFIRNELTEIDFGFKSDIGKFTQIVYPKSSLKPGKLEKLGFLYQPKYTFEKLQTDSLTGYVTFGESNKARLSVRSKISKLSAFYDTAQQCNKDEFVYYYLSPGSSPKFTMMLSVLSGSAQMYISEGLEDYPTLKRFWRKSVGSKGEEILVNEEDPSETKKVVSGYIVGVYCLEMSEISLLYMPDFTSLIKLQFQKLVDFNLQKGKEYYFDYYNKNQMFNTILYSDNSDLEVAALDFQVANNQNFAHMVSDPTNYSQFFVFKKGSMPRKHVTTDPSLVGKHIIVKMKALDSDTKLNFAIFDPTLPIVAFNEKRFHYVLSNPEWIVFMIKLGDEYEDIDLDVILDVGDIEILMSDKLENLNSASKGNVVKGTISKPSQKYFTYTVTKKSKINDVVIFNELFIKVKSNAFSKFSIFTKPKNKFKELKALESEIIFTDSEKDQYVYYFISSKEVSKIKSFQIQYSSLNFYGEKPELLYIPDVEVQIDSASPFLPMPLIEMKEKVVDEVNLTILLPEVRVGHFVLKIASHPSKLPIKISVLINDNVRVSPNGVHHGVIPRLEKKNHSFSMFLPAKGEFRILAESCFNLNVKSADFYTITSDKISKSFEFTDRYVQAYSFMQFNDYKESNHRELKEVSYSVKRGFVEDHGMLTFNLEIPPIPSSGDSRSEDHYYSLLTEFKPEDKELVLKDYITVFDESKDSEKFLFNYEYLNNGNSLKIFSRLPTFKPQMLVEYSDLKSVKIKLMFYLLSDAEIESKVTRCGFNVAETLTHFKHNITRIIKREDLATLNENRQVSISFSQEELEVFKTQQFVNVVSYASIRFFEDENEEYGISLDQKFTTVPYFLMTLPNKYSPIAYDFFWLYIFAGLIVAFALAICIGIYRRKPETGDKFGYTKGGDQSFSGNTRLEMSSISTKDPDN
jgi:hypothetical protein